jgi:adenylate cyclase
MPGPTTKDVARRLAVSEGTLRRWVRAGLIPLADGEWSGAAIAHARIVSHLRERGHGIEEIRRAADSGRLVSGYLQALFPAHEGEHDLRSAAAQTGLEPALIERLWLAAGLNAQRLSSLTDEDVDLLRHIAKALDAGVPLVALLQLVRVYGTAVAQIADAEVKILHLYVHEPMIRDGVPGVRVAEEMQGLAERVMPLAAPIVDHLHRRLVQHFVEQDAAGHLEPDAEAGADQGRLRVAIAFADLAGYTRLTEEAGEEEAFTVVERFVDAVARSLPDSARIVKTIGDEAMIVSTELAALVEWAVTFQARRSERPLPRIGIHHGWVLYRDGDYFGRAVNLASRVSARTAGGEVLVTRPVVEAVGARRAFSRVGEVKLKGFDAPTELFLAGSGRR